MATLADYEVSEAPSGGAPGVGGTSGAPNNGEGHGGVSGNGRGGGLGGGGNGGGGSGEAAVAGLVEASKAARRTRSFSTCE